MTKITENEYLTLYYQFRESIDTLCFPMIKEWAGEGFRPIISDGTPVGFLIIINGYVEGLFVLPEYRRKGLAKRAVKEYLATGGTISSLHIVNGNELAKAFWQSLFILKEESFCPVDTLYSVSGIRDTLKDR